MKRDKGLVFGLTAALFFIAVFGAGCGGRAVALEEIGAGGKAFADGEDGSAEKTGGAEKTGSEAETAGGRGTGAPAQPGEGRADRDAAGIEAGEAQVGSSKDRDAQGDEENFIYVYVCGEVVRPDVYGAAEGVRLYELIEMAGGFTEKAEESALNLAMKAQDGQRIYVPSGEEVRSSGGSGWSGQQGQDGALEPKTGGKININRAGAQELDSLPGIGSAKAESIVAYREENGGFGAIEEIKNVSGIGEALFERIRDSITTD